MSTVTVGPYVFDRVHWDRDVDVLTLGVTERDGVGDGDTAEGHTWMVDDPTIDIVGVIFMWPRRQLERDGGVYITLPSGDRVQAAEVENLVREMAA